MKTHTVFVQFKICVCHRFSSAVSVKHAQYKCYDTVSLSHVQEPDFKLAQAMSRGLKIDKMWKLSTRRRLCFHTVERTICLF